MSVLDLPIFILSQDLSPQVSLYAEIIRLWGRGEVRNEGDSSERVNDRSYLNGLEFVLYMQILLSVLQFKLVTRIQTHNKD